MVIGALSGWAGSCGGRPACTAVVAGRSGSAMPPSLPETARPSARPKVACVLALPLEELTEVVGGRIEGSADGVAVTGPVVIDGRQAGPGSLFVAFVGEH